MKEAWTIWFTGLHGAGKTTIAKSLAAILREKNIPIVVLDGDEVRKLISSDLGYTLEDRTNHMKRLADICNLISGNGIPTIACAASPTEKSREYAKSTIKNLFLVYVRCPLGVCEQRDTKGHYKKARNEELGFENFLGVSLKYEAPVNPDLILDTNKESAEESVNKLIHSLKENHIIRL